jgi:hypothetical protein
MPDDAQGKPPRIQPLGASVGNGLAEALSLIPLPVLLLIGDYFHA